MLKISLKKIALVIFFLIFIVAIFWWQSILTYSLEIYFNKYCHEKFAGSFKSKNMHFEKGNLIIDQPEIIGHQPLQDGGMHFKAERLNVAITPYWWNRQIDLKIEVHQPNLTVKQTTADIRNVVNDLFPSTSYITINSKISVEQGSIEFHDFKQNPPSLQKLFFRLEADCAQQNTGCLILSLDDPKLKNNCIILSLAQKEERLMALDFNFDAVKCSTFLKAARNFIPFLQYINADEGTITGQMSLTIPDVGRPYARGTLALNEVSFGIPAIELKGLVQEAHLHLNENPDSQENSFSKTLGHLNLTKEVALFFEKEGNHYCEITDLIGSIDFETNDWASLNLEGKCTHHDRTSHLKVEGNGAFRKELEEGIDCNVALSLSSSPEQEETIARFITKTYASKPTYAEIELSHFGCWDFDLFKMIFQPYVPHLSHIHMKEGYVDVSVVTSVHQHSIEDIRLEKIVARDLKFNLNPWDLEFKMSDLTGEVSLNLQAENFFNTLNAEIQIKNGQACFLGLNPNAYQLLDLQTQLSIHKGVIEKSEIKGIFAGLNGTIELDSQSSTGELIKFNLKGTSHEIISMLPEKMRERLSCEFIDDKLTILAGLRSLKNGIKIEGSLNFKGDQERHGHTIEFGFELEKTSDQLWGRWPPHHLAQSFWHDIGMEATLAAMPGLASPSTFAKTHWLKRELGIAGFVLHSGWLHAQNLNLKKYIEPFIFPNGNVKLKGQGDFQATFDHQSAIVNYDIRNVFIENNDLSIEIKSLNPSKERDPMLPLPGTLFVDFHTLDYYGILPIVNGICFEKSSGLLFTDVNALAILEGKRVHLIDWKTSCNGIDFAGKVDVDLSSPSKGTYNMAIYAHKIQGTFSQLQHLFSHFNALKFFQKFPVDGNLKLQEKEAYLQMGFSPKGVEIKCNIHGILSEGTATLHNASIELKNLQTKFAYDFETNRLEFSNTHGSVLVGKEDNIEEYILASDHFNFTDLSAKKANFDIWIGDNLRDIFRLVGNTNSKKEDSEGDQLIEITIDPELTHFGNVHPSKFELFLKNWTQIDYLNLELSLRLETILYDLQLASRSGMFFLPSKVLGELNKLKTANGEMEIAINYDDKTGINACRIKGEGVTIGKYSFKKCSLQGKKNGNIWAIDQLLLDDISLAADFVRSPNSWKVNFMGLRYGEAILLGMEGEYHDGENTVDAKINLLEINLAMLNEIPLVESFVNKSNLKGFMRGTGNFHFELNQKAISGWHVNATLNSAFKALQVNGLCFQDLINVQCYYDSAKGMTMKHLKTALKEGQGGRELGLLNIENIDYDFGKNEWLVEGFHFNIPASNLNFVSSLLHKALPQAVNGKTVAIISDLKKDENLEGTLGLTKSPAATNLQISLKEGTYYFQNSEHMLSNFILKYNLTDLKALTQYRWKNNVFWLSFSTTGPDFNQGLIRLSDHYPDTHLKTDMQPSLNIQWTNDQQNGLLIQKAEGVFNGLNVHLYGDREIPSNEKAICLQGKIGFDASKATNLISETLSAKARSWQMGSGFQLNGKWQIGKNKTEKISSQIHFNGVLEGHDIILKGYQFKNLHTHVVIHPNQIQFKQLKLEDPAVQLHIENGNVLEISEGEWMLKIPMINVSNFRPSLLQEPDGTPLDQGKALLIRHLELENVSGSLADSQFLTAKGKLQFLNPPKKNLQNTIFAIPGEILTMLGLDLTVLNPVSGTIFYEIKNGKAFLTKFKDIYSEGKLSKFNLANSTYPSYVDFEGNIQMQIRMKQYNLFFKLAELFTVNVGGTLKKPTYSLQKQSPK
jgi:hypothetical protein